MAERKKRQIGSARSASASSTAGSEADSSAAPTLADVIEQWQKQLLQLDRRNHLLYFKPGRSAIKIAEHSADSIFELLLATTRALTFDQVQRRAPRDESNPFAVPVEDEAPEQTDDYIVAPGDLRGDHPPLETERRLANLRHRYKEWHEEQGLEVLFLTLGVLTWVDEDGQESTSPLLLLPCDLSRSSPRDAYELTEIDDEPTTNGTLAVKLREFGLDLPVAEDIVTPGAYLQRVRQLIAKREGWSVADDVYLATFAYSKLAMWRDLEVMRTEGTDHPIVTTLALGEKSDKRIADQLGAPPLAFDLPNDLSGGRLDDIPLLREQLTVLPADYSQLIAIAKAKGSKSLIIHGPPGTGKSQTISNIIGTLIGEGKKVLFVSEKTAALDVVKRRLDECTLGIFCLDLHSERGKKANVYEQLRHAVDAQRVANAPQIDIAMLLRERDELNLVVRALHEIRPPLNMTAYQVQGLFAVLRDVPQLDVSLGDPGDLTPQKLAEIRSYAQRLALRSREFDEHETSRWHVLKDSGASIGLADRIRVDMEVVRGALEDLRKSESAARWLGLTAPQSLAQVIELYDMAALLASCPGIPASWLDPMQLPKFVELAVTQAQIQERYHADLATLAGVFGAAVPDLQFAVLGDLLTLPHDDESMLTRLLGGTWARSIAQDPGSVRDAVSGVCDLLTELLSTTSAASTTLGVHAPDRIDSIMELKGLLTSISRAGAIPAAWLEPGGLETVRSALDKAKEAAAHLQSMEDQLFASYEQGLVDAVDQEMLIRYRTDHQNRLNRWVRPSYRKDRNRIQAFALRTESIGVDVQTQVLVKALEIAALRSDWGSVASRAESIIGSLFNGRATDWERVVNTVEAVASLLLTRGSSRPEVIRALKTEGLAWHCDENIASLTPPMEHLDVWVREWASVDLADALQSGVMKLSEFLQQATSALAVLERIFDSVSLCTTAAVHPFEDLNAILEALQIGARIRASEGDQSINAAALVRVFDQRYVGFDTDWPEVDRSLLWAGSILEAQRGAELSPEFITHCTNPQPIDEYETATAELAVLQRDHQNHLSPLKDRYEFDLGPWSSFQAASFYDIQIWAESLASDADAAADWLTYLGHARDLDIIFEVAVVSQIRRLTSDSAKITAIIERLLWRNWLDWLYDIDPILKGFAATDHEALRARFTELDQKQPLEAVGSIRRSVFGGYPDILGTSTNSGQLSVLKSELSKKRRQLPVRRLLSAIPDVVQALKPCFLMSPLAVSQFLPLSSDPMHTIQFDVIIFDEASQIFPEDAIPAISRGKQLILAGDQKQLPPSNFWRRSVLDDEDEEIGDDEDLTAGNQIAGRESILTAALGLAGRLFDEAHLNVYYRSQCDSLIRFSNKCFYDDTLLTFPSANIAESCVRDVYVPEGRYEVGRRTNRHEAERVVDLVFEHMRRPGNDSIGVVALNRPHRDLIEQLIDERRLVAPELDIKFAESAEEPFFVKNLENVQGDERDHMIISTVYGRSLESGQVYNRFGPINSDGGERRLNVTITRARKEMDVVHSLLPSDIHAESTGGRLLRRFLEYVADPEHALEAGISSSPDAEPDSPFEEAVEAALVARGHRVARQVGVAGYRIDLGILSENGARYDLGVECDGWTYHSAPASRDRDWLRQKVLEGLGWHIHRIWSTAWIRNPQAEIERLEHALRRAREGGDSANSPQTDATTKAERSDVRQERPGPAASQGTPIQQQVAPLDSHLDLEPYETATNLRTGPKLQFESSNTLQALILEVARVEGPVHREVVIERLRLRYGLSRVRGSTRDHVEWEIRRVIDNGAVKSEADFIWVDDEQLARAPRTPPDNRIEHVSPHELNEIVLRVAKAVFGAPRDELVSETARQLGFARTGVTIKRVLGSTVDQLLAGGDLSDSFGTLKPTR